MERKFNIKFERVNEKTIVIRFYSVHNIKLIVSQINAFYSATEYDDFGSVIMPVYLNNDYKIKSLDFPQTATSYRSLSLIVKDKTNKCQFAVIVPLDGTEVNYQTMLYEGD